MNAFALPGQINLSLCDEVTKYERIAMVGQGSTGEVSKAKNKTTKQIVALKKIMIVNREGLIINVAQEIGILQKLNHENVIKLIEICRTKASSAEKNVCYLVLDFCEHDLSILISNTNVYFPLGAIKMVMKQLLDGLHYIHSQMILHRDVKPANILINKNGDLKIADFGLARTFSVSTENAPNSYTNNVVTLWYRPPELLLGERNYGPAIDLWGAGCTMAEMWTRTPILQGEVEQHQLQLIMELCGSINTKSFPGAGELDLYYQIDLPQGLERRVQERFEADVTDKFALALLDKLLTICPVKRINSYKALCHDFFHSEPQPSHLSKILPEVD